MNESCSITLVWGESQQAAFERLRDALTQSPCLLIPDSSKPFFLHTGASNIALGAVLFQQDTSGSLRPCAFWSKKLGGATLNHSDNDKELLAVVHKKRNLTPRHARWRAELDEYPLELTYLAGKRNVAADTLPCAAWL